MASFVSRHRHRIGRASLALVALAVVLALVVDRSWLLLAWAGLPGFMAATRFATVGGGDGGPAGMGGGGCE